MRRMIELATQYGRYGYRRITALLQREQWRVNHKRVERLWRLEGLKVPKRQPKRRRLWLNDGSCVRLRPGHRDHVWSYDFVLTRTHDGRAVRMLTILDEYSRECLAIDVARRLTSEDVLERLTDLFIRRGVPDYIRSDNGAEFTPMRFETGWFVLACGRCTSSRAVPGRMATSSASTASCGTSSWRTVLTRCWRPKS